MDGEKRSFFGFRNTIERCAGCDENCGVDKEGEGEE
jgi:hypothetical protein